MGAGKDDPNMGHPDVLAENAIMKVQDTNNPALRWVGIDMDVWPSGWLFAVDCDGKSIAAIETGSVKSLQVGPAIPNFDRTILVNAMYAVGTGAESDSYTLFGFKDRHLVVLWKHESLDSGVSPGQYEDEMEFKIVELTSKVIRLAGKHQVNRWIPNDTKQGGDWNKTPVITKTTESYCWDQTKSSFVSCLP